MSDWTAPAVPPQQRRSAMHGESGYERRKGDAYFTEHWVTQALLDSYPIEGPIWEPACGRGDMAKVLMDAGHSVHCSDLIDHGCWFEAETRVDFLLTWRPPQGYRSIITNPPYARTAQFIEHALGMDLIDRQVAMLLRNEYDCARTRQALFERPDFSCKIVLTKRPRWNWWTGEDDKASPRHNFAWFIWDKQASQGGRLRYAP